MLTVRLCRPLELIDGKVVIYRAKTSGHTTIIEEISRWNHNYLVTNIACKDNIIAVGDAISSVSLLRLERDGLRTIARDYESLHPIALDLTNTHDMVGATVRFQYPLLLAAA